MADQVLEGGSQPVDLSKHPSGIVPTLQFMCVNVSNLAIMLEKLAIVMSCDRKQLIGGTTVV
ncbi:hypothetical protein HanPI659440_Chr03g0114811 [Helianthus annuus]|nr:hypothetical protein HanPI659440_Chr03g0114811 [Helianthus annuus]